MKGSTGNSANPPAEAGHCTTKDRLEDFPDHPTQIKATRPWGDPVQ